MLRTENIVDQAIRNINKMNKMNKAIDDDINVLLGLSILFYTN